MLVSQEDKNHQEKYQEKYQGINNHHQYPNHQRRNNWLNSFRHWNKGFSNWDFRLKQED